LAVGDEESSKSKYQMTNIKNTKNSLTSDIGYLPFRRNGGFTLFYAMLISSLLLSIGLAIFNITYKEFILTAGVRESEGAFYAADSALECALYWDYIHAGSGAPAFGFYGDSLASGLAGYWRFEEDDQNLDKAFDSSGQGNQGTVFGDQSRVIGYIGNALLFDGSGDYMNVGEVNGLTFSNTEETPHTISARVKIDELPAESKIPLKEWILLIGEDASGHGWTIDSAGIFSAGNQDGGTVVSGNLGTGWHHVVITYGGDELGGYIDGAPLESQKAANLFSGLSGTQPLTLGKPFPEGGDDIFLNGELDDVRVYNRVLSTDEISALFQGISHNEFVAPVAGVDSSVKDGGGIELKCANQVINDINPSVGWAPPEGPGNWTITPDNPVADGQSKTVFDMSFDDNTCALVEVTKKILSENNSATTIISRGYNTCNLNSPRRLERALKATY
jgi:hypothetical protein